MRNLLIKWLTWCLLAAVLVGTAETGQAAQGTLTVSATIRKLARVTVVRQPSSIVVTPADISRGYVDVAVPTELAIRSNSVDGYALEFATIGGFFRDVSVFGLGNEVQLGGGSGVVARAPAGRGMATQIVRLAFRLALTQAVQAGTYAWPMQISVTPL